MELGLSESECRLSRRMTVDRMIQSEPPFPCYNPFVAVSCVIEKPVSHVSLILVHLTTDVRPWHCDTYTSAKELLTGTVDD